VEDWLVGQHMVLGVIPFQNWMLIALVIVEVWLVFILLTRSPTTRDSFFALAWLVVVLGWLRFVTFGE
jgi:hypothetical protein